MAARFLSIGKGYTPTKIGDIMQVLISDEKIKKLVNGILAVESLINESYGVSGLHLNGDDAPWDSLQTGGCFEEWLLEFDEALSIATELQNEEDRKRYGHLDKEDK